MSIIAGLKGLTKSAARAIGKHGKKATDAIKKSYKQGVKEGSKKTAKTTSKKGPNSRKEFTKRGSATGKGKYGTKGSAKGYAAYVKSFGKTGKTTGKGTKGKGTAWYNKKYNPLGKGVSAKNVVTAIPRGVVGTAKWAKSNPVDAIVYGVGANWAGKKLGLWGNKSKNTPEPIKQTKPNYIGPNKIKSIERDGGPVRAHGGRVAPGMKTGGLRYINGKWVRI